MDTRLLLCIALFLCAFVVPPLVQLNNAQGDHVDKYENAADNELSQVSILIDPKIKVLPGFPKLVINGEAFGGMAGLYFNENGVFNLGQFNFYIPAKNKEEVNAKLKEASLLVGDVLNKATAKDVVFSSNVKALNIIMK